MQKIPMKMILVSLALGLTLAARAAEVPDEEDVKSMTETSLTSFGRAVKKKDFSKFYEELAGVWQKQTSPEKLEEAFKDFLDKNIDLVSVVKEKEPVFNHPAAIGDDDVLVIKGYYPTTPNRVIFQLKYLEEEGDWKLVGINVNLAE
jgi:hypothetical protein